MKLNQWTLGLAAVGAVSLASVVSADEAKVSQVQTALSSTTLSGYVDVAAQYNLGNNTLASTAPLGVGAINGANHIDSFSLNDVDIALDKPLDESPRASGYHVDLNYGDDALTPLGQNTPIRQAYVALRTPLGNGIDWKAGVFDNILGYESNTYGSNPNYTRSYGYWVEPGSYLGLLGSYKITSLISVQAGIANSLPVGNYNLINATSTSAKSYLAALALTAPDSWGFLKGATLNFGFNDQVLGSFKPTTTPEAQQNYYAGLTLPTPVAALKFGAAFDLISYANKTAANSKNDSSWIAGVYTSYQATDKLSLNLRGEYVKDDSGNLFNTAPGNQAEELTATVQYNLWANVISRAEFRWDHLAHGTQFGSNEQNANAYLLALNLVYQF